MANGMTDKELQQWAEDYAEKVREGYLLSSDQGANSKGAPTVASELRKKWNRTSSAVNNRVKTIYEKGFGEIINKAIRERDPSKVKYLTSASMEGEVVIAEPDVDQRIRERRLEQELQQSKRREAELVDRIIELQDLRGQVMELTEALEAPSVIRPLPGDKRGGRRTAILHISDVHAGEHVSLYEMDGLNSYSPEICHNRMERLFQKTASLLTEHWSGDPVDEVVIGLGGDMIDGNLREESRRGGALDVVSSVKLVSEVLAGGFSFLKKELDQLGVDVPIRAYTSPGNHSRLTPKPHIVEGNIDNLDVLVSWSVEKILGPVDWAKFYQPGSGECLFNVYGWWFLLRHGHEGSSGSGGMYGPVYKQVRGMYKAQTSYARRRRPVNWVLQGHDHTRSVLPFGIANSSVVGYNPFAMRKLLADPSPASQNLIIVEQKHGIIDHKEIFLGVPSEGSLYEVPEIDEEMIRRIEEYTDLSKT